MIYLVKTITLCKGMAWLPFQKEINNFKYKQPEHSYRRIFSHWVRETCRDPIFQDESAKIGKCSRSSPGNAGCPCWLSWCRESRDHRGRPGGNIVQLVNTIYTTLFRSPRVIYCDDIRPMVVTDLCNHVFILMSINIVDIYGSWSVPVSTVV